MSINILGLNYNGECGGCYNEAPPCGAPICSDCHPPLLDSYGLSITGLGPNEGDCRKYFNGVWTLEKTLFQDNYCLYNCTNLPAYMSQMSMFHHPTRGFWEIIAEIPVCWAFETCIFTPDNICQIDGTYPGTTSPQSYWTLSG